MASTMLKKDVLYSVGVLNPSMRIFDVVLKTEYGTSYNSYILKGKEKTALIEACHLTFFEPFIENIKEVCSLSEIDYIVLNHCEPDHSGVMSKLLELCPNASIVVSKPGSLYLKDITNRDDLPMIIAKDGDKIDLGGRELTFFITPFLHWPDSMLTFCQEDKVLFSCDFFGAHFCEPYVYDKNVVYREKYETAFREYYDAIFSPFKTYVQNGLDKIKGLDIELICNSHGPVLTKEDSILPAIEKYRQWSRSVMRLEKHIPVFYCSAYGNTGLVAKAIQEGIMTVIPDAVCEVFDINEFDMQDLSQKINDADAICVGSPTINSDAVAPVWQLLSSINAINSRRKPAAVFGSYGWSGEAVPNISARLEGLKMKLFGEGLRVKFVPSQEELEMAKNFGIDFAKSLEEK